MLVLALMGHILNKVLTHAYWIENVFKKWNKKEKKEFILKTNFKIK